MEGRHMDQTVVVCIDQDCGWKGPISQCQHGYEPITDGDEPDVTPCDYCPKCGAIIGREKE